MQNEELQDVNKEVLDSFLCPSFNSYATNQLASIAEQVGRDQNGTQNDEAFIPRQNDDTEFEFFAFQKAVDEGASFDDAAFPLFNRDLLTDHRGNGSGGNDSSAAEDAAALRFPMERLLITGGRDRRSDPDSPPPPSESSSEDNDLEGIPAGTYCTWIPYSPQASPIRCQKSNSTGSSSSKRWKLLDLLRRSNSDGKDSFAFLTSSPENKKGKDSEKVEVAGKQKSKAVVVGGDGGEKKVRVSAHEALYVRNRELRSLDKRRSFLPYRQDLVGFCRSRLGKAFPSV